MGTEHTHHCNADSVSRERKGEEIIVNVFVLCLQISWITTTTAVYHNVLFKITFNVISRCCFVYLLKAPATVHDL